MPTVRAGSLTHELVGRLRRLVNSWLKRLTSSVSTRALQTTAHAGLRRYWAQSSLSPVAHRRATKLVRWKHWHLYGAMRTGPSRHVPRDDAPSENARGQRNHRNAIRHNRSYGWPHGSALLRHGRNYRTYRKVEAEYPMREIKNEQRPTNKARKGWAHKNKPQAQRVGNWEQEQTPNQPMERTPPCCALRRRSSAR